MNAYDYPLHTNPGDFYDVTHLTSFLVKNSAIPSFRGYSASYKAVADPDPTSSTSP